MSKQIDEGLRLAIEKAGNANALAKLLGMSTQALMEWRRTPTHRILQVEAVTGVRRETLRPDLYVQEESSMRQIHLSDVAAHVINASYVMEAHEISLVDVGDAALQGVMAFIISKTKQGGVWAQMPADLQIAVARAIAQGMVAQHFADKQFFDSARWENGDEPPSQLDAHPLYVKALDQLIKADAFGS